MKARILQNAWGRFAPHSFYRLFRAILFLTFASFMGTKAFAEDKAGFFDFYVLALSWSPSYCAAEGDKRRDEQCAAGRRFSFVVHGLWPQYERGYPKDCPTSARGPTEEEARALLDLMPSLGLVRHQWRKHGRCSGLSAEAFFALSRRAAEQIVIPAIYTEFSASKMVEPGAVEADFIAANPGLSAKGIAITCDGTRLREARICLTKDLALRDCPEVDARACRRKKVVMPPVRRP